MEISLLQYNYGLASYPHALSCRVSLGRAEKQQRMSSSTLLVSCNIAKLHLRWAHEILILLQYSHSLSR